MTEKEILKKAIEKAVRNGWDANKWSVRAFIDENNVFRCSDLEKEDAFNIIFDHSFAKAFWGEGKLTTFKECKTCGNLQVDEMGSYGWEDHLKEMVTYENPIQYLAKFLEKKGKGK